MNKTLRVVHPAKAKEFFEAQLAFTCGPAEVDHLLHEQKENINLIDVRAAKDYAAGHLPGAINLPQDQWAGLKGLRRDTTNIVYCYNIVCHLAKKAALEFASKGFPVMEMEGGFKEWKAEGRKIETEAPLKAAS